MKGILKRISCRGILGTRVLGMSLNPGHSFLGEQQEAGSDGRNAQQVDKVQCTLL